MPQVCEKQEGHKHHENKCEIHNSAIDSGGIHIDPDKGKPLSFKDRSIRELQWQNDKINQRIKAIDIYKINKTKQSVDLNNPNSEYAKENKKALQRFLEISQEEKNQRAHKFVRSCDDEGCNYKTLLKSIRRRKPKYFEDIVDDYADITKNGVCTNKASINISGKPENCNVKTYMKNFQKVQASNLEKESLLTAYPQLEYTKSELGKFKFRNKSILNDNELNKLNLAVGTRQHIFLLNNFKNEKSELMDLQKKNKKLRSDLKKSSGVYMGRVGFSKKQSFKSRINQQHETLVDISNNYTGFLSDLLDNDSSYESYKKYGDALCSAQSRYESLLEREEKYLDDYLFFVPGVALASVYRKNKKCRSLELKFQIDPSPRAIEDKEKCWKELSSESAIALASTVGGSVVAVGAKAFKTGKKLEKQFNVNTKSGSSKVRLDKLKSNKKLRDEYGYRRITTQDHKNEAERLEKARKLLGRKKLSKKEKKAILRAHFLCKKKASVANLGTGNALGSVYTNKCLAYKADILRANLKSNSNNIDSDIRKLFDNNITGSKFSETPIPSGYKKIQGNGVKREFSEAPTDKVTLLEPDNGKAFKVVVREKDGKKFVELRNVDDTNGTGKITGKEMPFDEFPWKKVKGAIIPNKPSAVKVVTKTPNAPTVVKFNKTTSSPSSTHIEVPGKGFIVRSENDLDYSILSKKPPRDSSLKTRGEFDDAMREVKRRHSFIEDNWDNLGKLGTQRTQVGAKVRKLELEKSNAGKSKKRLGELESKRSDVQSRRSTLSDNFDSSEKKLKLKMKLTDDDIKLAGRYDQIKQRAFEARSEATRAQVGNKSIDQGNRAKVLYNKSTGKRSGDELSQNRLRLNEKGSSLDNTIKDEAAKEAEATLKSAEKAVQRLEENKKKLVDLENNLAQRKANYSDSMSKLDVEDAQLRTDIKDLPSARSTDFGRDKQEQLQEVQEQLEAIKKSIQHKETNLVNDLEKRNKAIQEIRDLSN